MTARQQTEAEVVTWGRLIGLSTLIIMLVGGLLAVVMEMHTSSTHPGAFTRAEFQQFERRIDGSIDTVKGSLEEQGRKLDTILVEVRKR